MNVVILQVAKFIQLTATVIGGFTIAFVKGWELAVVLLACIPCLVIAGGTMAIMMMKKSSCIQMAYADAANVVDQTVTAIRTVSPLN